MEQNMTLNNTLSEEDRILDVKRGGCSPAGICLSPYCGYNFVPRQRNDDELFEITHDIMEYFAKDKVIEFDCQYSKSRYAKKELFKGWRHPEYVEDGKVNEFKQYLINSNRRDLIWDDYMRYVSYDINILFFSTETRFYGRHICILQEYFDWELICMAGECSSEDKQKEVGINIYPHSKIMHLENDSKTVESYVNSKDTFLIIAFHDSFHNITIRPNPRYISYEQLLETIKPIIEKHGWKLGNTENPFIEALQCNVNCIECDETECAYYLKGKNPRVDQTYYRVNVD